MGLFSISQKVFMISRANAAGNHSKFQSDTVVKNYEGLDLSFLHATHIYLYTPIFSKWGTEPEPLHR
jgi:hypothetical protein